jgi:hypothetical protein
VRRHPHTQIVAPAKDVDVAVIALERKFQQRVFLHEREEQRAKIGCPKGHRRSDAQAATQGRRVTAGRLVDSLLQARHDIGHARVETLAGVGDGDTA